MNVRLLVNPDSFPRLGNTFVTGWGRKGQDYSVVVRICQGSKDLTRKEFMFEMRARSTVDDDLPEVLVGSLTT